MRLPLQIEKSLKILIGIFISVALITFFYEKHINSLKIENGFDWYRIMSVNIFLKCNEYYCESFLIPLLSNILNLNNNYIQYTNANIIYYIFVGSFFNIFILYKENIKIALFSIFIIQSSIFYNLYFLQPNFPDFIFIYCSVFSIYCYLKFDKYIYFLLPFSLHPTLALFILFFLIAIILLEKPSKKNHITLINLINITALGFMLSKIYLLLVDSSGYESRFKFIINNFHLLNQKSGLLNANLFDTLNYITIGCLLFYLILNKSRIKIIQLFFVITIGLILEFLSFDPIRIYRTFTTPLLFYIYYENCLSKK